MATFVNAFFLLLVNVIANDEAWSAVHYTECIYVVTWKGSGDIWQRLGHHHRRRRRHVLIYSWCCSRLTVVDAEALHFVSRTQGAGHNVF